MAAQGVAQGGFLLGGDPAFLHADDNILRLAAYH